MQPLHHLEMRFQEAVWQQAASTKSLTPAKLYQTLLWQICREWPSIIIILLTIGGTAGLFVYGLVAGTISFMGCILIVIAGVLLEGSFLGMSVRDGRKLFALKVNLMPPHLRFQINSLKSRRLRAKLGKALQIWGQVADLAAKTPQPIWQAQATTTLREVTLWVQKIYRVACQVDQAHLTLATERKTNALPVTTMQMMGQQMAQAELQLDDTLAMMGRVHVQLQVLATQRELERGQRLDLEDIQAELERLQDFADVMQR